MSGKRSDLLRRQQALEATARRFRKKGLAWGKSDCIVMGRAHLVAMGHRGLPKIPRYSTPQGALRALKGTGFDNVEALVDSLLPRIQPAAMLPGDLALLEGDNPLGALVISVGQKVMGFHEEHDETVMMTPLAFRAAWRA